MRMRPTRFLQVLLLAPLVTAAGWVLSGGVLAQGPPGQRTTDRVNGQDVVAGEVIVKYLTPRTTAELAQTDAIVAATKDDDLGANGRLRHIHSDRFDAATLVSYFSGAPGGEYAEPNHIVHALATPNDPGFPGLWGLKNDGWAMPPPLPGVPGADIDAPLAWNITTGSANIVVGVVDTGVWYNHEDLIGNIWTAPSNFTVTIGGQSINCPAGSHGFNAITNTCDPLDDNDHGTHVSGTIGARGNNGKFFTGVNWTTSIMGLKFLSAEGSGSIANAIKAIDFAIKAKQVFGSAANVRVLSNSWGCPPGLCFSQALLDKINEANNADMLFVAAAGNDGSNSDLIPSYPASYDAPNVVAVAATDDRDLRATFSNYGATTVDLGAPGVYVASTIRNNGYAFWNGTSMATPHVSGAAALVLSACPMNTTSLKSLILGNVDLIPSMTGITVTGGRLNVYKAITACPTPFPPTNLSATAGNGQVALQWNASAGAAAYIIARGTTSGNKVFLNWTAQTTYTDNAVVNGTTYYYVVIAVNMNAVFSAPSNEASATPQ